MAGRPDWFLTHNTKAFHPGGRKANWTERHYSRGVLPNPLLIAPLAHAVKEPSEQNISKCCPKASGVRMPNHFSDLAT